MRFDTSCAFFSLLFLCLEGVAVSLQRTFEGYSVLRVLPTREEQLALLNELATDASPGHDQKLNFWRRPSELNSSVDLMIAPEIRDSTLQKLREARLEPHTFIQDLEELVRSERESVENSSLLYGPSSWTRDGNTFFQDYHRLSEIHQYLDELARLYPNRASTEVIGYSSERRELKVIKIGNPSSNGYLKTIIWIDGGIHAREWISPATALFMANTLVRNPDNNAEIEDLLNKFDFVILPSSNPDGYEYSHTSDRMWRKTRSRTGTAWDFVCRGVDPNRNWAHHWNEVGSSNNPCSDIYAGRKAFSEPETKAMSDYIMRIKDRTAMYLSLHSYSQLVLTPWGYTKELPPAYPDMEKRALSGTKALAAKYGTAYRVGSSTNVLYAAAGGSDDWAHGVANIKYAYTFELRDTGDNGFVLPKEQIIPTGEETFEALKVISQEIAVERGLSP
jgi:murein tripeptide amidase MpaA